MSKWLVLGLGNPLSGADGFGPAVIEALRASPDLLPGVELVDVHTDLGAFLDRFAEHDGVVLVDAVLTADGDPPPADRSYQPSQGRPVARVAEETFSRWDDRSPGAHELSPLMWVRLFRQLHEAAAVGAHDPVITLVALATTAEEFHGTPTPAEIAAGAAAVRHILTDPKAPLHARS